MRAMGPGAVVLVLSLSCAIDRIEHGDRAELKGSFGGSGATSSGSGATGGSGMTSATGGATSSSTTSSSVSSTMSSSTVASGGGGGNCVDFGKPNDTEVTAHDLGKLDDCDVNTKTLAAALTNAQDVDWYTYAATDVFGCTVDPHRKLTPPSTLRMCKFAECFIGNTTVSCKNDATPTVSPAGRAGCCHNLSFGMTVDCKGLNDDANVYIRLDQGPSTCTEYSLEYHY